MQPYYQGAPGHMLQPQTQFIQPQYQMATNQPAYPPPPLMQQQPVMMQASAPPPTPTGPVDYGSPQYGQQPIQPGDYPNSGRRGSMTSSVGYIPPSEQAPGCYKLWAGALSCALFLLIAIAVLTVILMILLYGAESSKECCVPHTCSLTFLRRSERKDWQEGDNGVCTFIPESLGLLDGNVPGGASPLDTGCTIEELKATNATSACTDPCTARVDAEPENQGITIMILAVIGFAIFITCFAAPGQHKEWQTGKPPYPTMCLTVMVLVATIAASVFIWIFFPGFENGNILALRTSNDEVTCGGQSYNRVLYVESKTISTLGAIIGTLSFFSLICTIIKFGALIYRKLKLEPHPDTKKKNRMQIYNPNGGDAAMYQDQGY